MKAKYEKPALEVVALELNAAIAASACNSSEPKTLTLDEACQFPREDYGENPFTGDSDSCDVIVEGYCYFTSANIIFNS